MPLLKYFKRKRSYLRIGYFLHVMDHTSHLEMLKLSHLRRFLIIQSLQIIGTCNKNIYYSTFLLDDRGPKVLFTLWLMHLDLSLCHMCKEI